LKARKTDLRSKCVLVADHGLFVELAPRLAREFGHVKLWVPWMSGYPRSAQAHVGCGIEGVERVERFWDHAPDADLIVFPDLYMADMARICKERLNKSVWSHLDAEILELDRTGTRKLQKKLGISAPRTRRFVGVEALSDYLRGTENKWVKISTFRGDGETWHHDTWHTTEILLNEFVKRVGALAGCYEFMVEDHVEGIEVGYDGFTFRGEWPDAAYWGFEIKDQGYVGKFSPYSEMPKEIRHINAAVAPVLKEEGAVGFCSFEFRLTEGSDAVMIDPCMRCGSPPVEGVMEGYENLGEVMWVAAHGDVPAVQSAGEYVAIAMISSQFATQNWVPIDFPPSIERWVKLRNKAVVDGKVYHVPTFGDWNQQPEIGAVVAVADTLEEAKRLVRERAEKVRGYLVEVSVDALDCAEDEIARAKKYGVEF
jgi:hypothetical protein